SSQTLNAQVNQETLRVDTNLVLIDVLVFDKQGGLVRGLKAEQIEVFDEGAKRPLESFSAEEASVSFGINFDMHPTTDERTRSVIGSLRQFKAELKADDDVFLVAFNMRGQQTFDFIPTFEQLERHMAKPDKREPNSLYDAVYFASDRILSSRNRKRVLLIISDSADHRSRHTFSQIRQKVRDIRAEVYAVVLDDIDGYGYSDMTHKGREYYPFSRDASSHDRAAIIDLAMKTGGSTFFGGSQNALRLFAIYKQIAEEMRSHYTLGFYPDAIDDKRHNVRIKLRGVEKGKDLVLTYQTSYQNRKRPVRP
ncbi:MAG: VWA domain-containing protein, partial [Pyrinomonadaceae bacterium]